MDSPTTVSSPAMPAPIAKAVAEVMGQIKSLPKDERNDHGQYNFASIDAFLAAIGPLCVSAGLIIIQDEDSLEILDRGGKGWVRISFSFTLAHSSGVLWERPLRRTVLQQIAGPQTTGSAQSYALKMFMRSLFQIPTGDMDDADYQPKATMETRQERQERVQPDARPVAPPAPPPAIQGGSGEPVRIAIPQGDDGLQVGRWTRVALDTLAQAPGPSWRARWLEIHKDELADVARLQPGYAARVREMAGAADAAPVGV